jgi:hypothetical protein
MIELPHEDLCDAEDSLVLAALGFATLVDSLMHRVSLDASSLPANHQASELDLAVLGLIALRRSLRCNLTAVVDHVDVPSPSTPPSIRSLGDLLR